MKKLLLAAVTLGALIALPGCNNRSDDPVQKIGHQETLRPMPQSWRGVIPCADCEGIETSLFLNQDGTWVMNEHYLKGAKSATFGSWGRWARTAEKLVLTDGRGEKRYYQVKGDRLEMLARDGSPVTSSRSYALAPVKASLPTTPMAMRGMYTYSADVAMFTDCATGVRLPVNNTIVLEEGYAAASRSSEKPVLLVIKGHLTLEPNPDSGAMETILVPDGRGEFQAGKSCAE